MNYKNKMDAEKYRLVQAQTLIDAFEEKQNGNDKPFNDLFGPDGKIKPTKSAFERIEKGDPDEKQKLLEFMERMKANNESHEK